MTQATHALRGCTVTVVIAQSVDAVISGELDMSDCADVVAIVRTAIASGKPTTRIHLAELTFADPTAIKVFILSGVAARDAGTEFVLLNPSAQVTRLIDVTGLTTSLPVVVDPDVVNPVV